MKFKLDENFSPALAPLLTSRGHDVDTAGDEGLLSQPDERIAEAARAEGRAILTLDTDFLDTDRFNPADFAGIVVFRLHDSGLKAITAALSRIADELSEKTLSGSLWVVDDWRVRVVRPDYPRRPE